MSKLDDLDFLTLKIPRPLAQRWMRNGLDLSNDKDMAELQYWLRAGFDWHNSKYGLFQVWGQKYLQ